MIDVAHLCKDYGPFRALDDVPFHVDQGEIVGFLGPNGAGKTTAMRILAGYMPPSEGRASVAGFDPRQPHSPPKPGFSSPPHRVADTRQGGRLVKDPRQGSGGGYDSRHISSTRITSRVSSTGTYGASSRA